MLARRIIPCLDVKAGAVVKGVRFRDHEVVGGIEDLAARYAAEGADELVFYDITASVEGRTVSPDWVARVARSIDIPFAVAGGIRTVEDAAARLERGADKISINSPALERPKLIDELVDVFGSQCIVIGVDSRREGNDWLVQQYTGDPDRTVNTARRMLDWLAEVQDRGAGEVVLNCMDQDGVREGYDIEQLARARNLLTIPLVASGGAGAMEHFRDVFHEARVDAALAASVFHKGVMRIADLKQYLVGEGVMVRQ